MKKRESSNKLLELLMIIGIVIVIIIALLITYKSLQVGGTGNQTTSKAVEKFNNHVSKDLRISFYYPNNWFLSEKDRDILIASYNTSIGEGSTPDKSQLKIFINNESLCQETLDKEVLLGGCGEGATANNEILSKEVKEFPAGLFITYKIKYPTGKPDTFYFLQQKHGDRIIQISKQPDPSQFEKEFNAIVESITFL